MTVITCGVSFIDCTVVFVFCIPHALIVSGDNGCMLSLQQLQAVAVTATAAGCCSHCNSCRGHYSTCNHMRRVIHPTCNYIKVIHFHITCGVSFIPHAPSVSGDMISVNDWMSPETMRAWGMNDTPYVITASSVVHWMIACSVVQCGAVDEWHSTCNHCTHVIQRSTLQHTAAMSFNAPHCSALNDM